MQVLGVEHKLHVRKILVSRDKLKPLTAKEREMMNVVLREVLINPDRSNSLY